MTSMGCVMKITSIVLCGFLFHVFCLENREKCFDVEGKTICYFIPNISHATWDTAWKTCRDMGAALPVISSENVQNVLSDYLSDRFSRLKPVWTAGRYAGDGKWRWLNGEALTGADEPSCPRNLPPCPHETQAVLTKQLKYDARYPYRAFNYICSFTEARCSIPSNDSIPWKNGCLKWKNNDMLPLDKARNKCLEGGGDLATFNEDGDLQLLRRFSHNMLDNTVYWVGLHRKWWIWNATEVQDMKYNLLDGSKYLENNCLFIDNRDKWINGDCTSTKDVICQTVKDSKKTILTMRDANETSLTTTGIVIAVLVAVVATVVILVMVKKRFYIAKVKAETDPSTVKSDAVSPSQNSVAQSPDDTYATIDLDDNLENLDYENGPNPNTSYTRVEFCDNSAVYSEPTDFDASKTDRSTDVYSDPYSIVTPVPKNFSPTSGIYTDPFTSGQEMTSDKLKSPPD